MTMGPLSRCGVVLYIFCFKKVVAGRPAGLLGCRVFVASVVAFSVIVRVWDFGSVLVGSFRGVWSCSIVVVRGNV